jgi:endonuclease I
LRINTKTLKQFLPLLFTLTTLAGLAQTNPPAQTLPVTINFGTANYTPPFTNMAAWAASGAGLSTQALAEASVPAANATVLTAGAPAATGGQYGDGTGSNGRLTIVTSSNTTNGATQAALAINTTGATGITISYDLSLQVANLRIVGLVLQYRLGTSGAFTTIATTPVTYSTGTTNGGDADGPTDWDSYSVALPAAAENQAVVQLRWATWRGTAAGNSSAVGIDNISISTAVTTPCTDPTAQPTALSLTAITSTQVNGSFTAASPVADNYLIVRSLSSTLSGNPVDGTSYSAGQALGGGTVVSFAAATSFANTGLSANTTFYYFVFSTNDDNCSGGPNYLTTTPALTGSATTPPLAACVTPPAPTALVLTPGVNSISVSYAAAAGATKYLGVVSTSSTLSAGPMNGTVYTNGQALGGGTVKYYGPATNFVATGLTAGTVYYIFVFALADGCTGEPNYNAASLTGTTTTLTGVGIPPNYYDAASTLTCSSLKTALFNIIKPTVANPAPTYDGICDIYPSTDYRKSDDLLRDIIWDMYSDNPTGADPYEFEYGIDVDGCGGVPNNPPIPGTLEGRMYNREHSFPRSWFGGQVEPMNSDAMHIFPTDKEVNNRRSSFAYGETTTPAWTSLNGSKLGPCTYPGYTGTVFEPINEYKGDFARAQFYMATCYESNVAAWQPNADFILNGTAYQAFDDWYLKLLYKWHINDPVSQKEIDRNNAVYTLQGNRNPFIDKPEWVYEAWSCTGLIVLVPIRLYNFSVYAQGTQGVLQWKADRASQFSHFEIERSFNGTNFQYLGRMNVNATGIDYRFADDLANTNGTVYYRIKMVDQNGAFEYSDIKLLKLNRPNGGLTLYPNPAGNRLQVSTGAGIISSLQVFDVYGRQAINISSPAGGTINIELLTPGKYILKATTASGSYTGSFIKL